jgi:hypothetical protein
MEATRILGLGDQWPWPKYNGHTIQWIIDNDPNYLRWMVENLLNDSTQNKGRALSLQAKQVLRERIKELKETKALQKELQRMAVETGTVPSSIISGKTIHDSVKEIMMKKNRDFDAVVGLHSLSNGMAMVEQITTVLKSRKTTLIAPAKMVKSEPITFRKKTIVNDGKKES